MKQLRSWCLTSFLKQHHDTSYIINTSCTQTSDIHTHIGPLICLALRTRTSPETDFSCAWGEWMMCVPLQVSVSSFIDSSLFLFCGSLFLCCAASWILCLRSLILFSLLSVLFVASSFPFQTLFFGTNATNLVDQKTNLRGESPEDCLRIQLSVFSHNMTNDCNLGAVT